MKNTMTLKQLIKLENKADTVWVISPTLHYDTENKDFSELVSVNLGAKKKYRYIVPATRIVEKNMKLYQKMYKLTDTEMFTNFLLLPDNDFNGFLTETVIYNAGKECIACTAPPLESTNDIIKYGPNTAKAMAKQFKATWKKYMRTNP